MTPKSRHTWTYQLPDPERQLVFGLRWEPLLGDDLLKQGKQRALAAKAKHYLVVDSSYAAVGYGSLDLKQGANKAKQHISAAALFAKENKQGVSLACIALPSDHEEPLFWVIASHDGVVVAGTDILLPRAMAETLLQQLRERFSFHVEVKDFAFDRPKVSSTDCVLAECKTALQSIPLPVRVGVLAGVIFMGLNGIYGHWKAEQEANIQKSQQPVKIDGAKVWNEHLIKWAQTQRIDGPEGLTKLYEAVSRIPMRLGNWTLTHIDCTAQAQDWLCRYGYSKATYGTNQSLLQNAPATWSIGWDGLDKAVATTRIEADRHALDVELISTSEETSSVLISQIQVVLPAFQIVKISEPTQAKIDEPTVIDNLGAAHSVPYPAGEAASPKLPNLQSLQFYGPLRSFARLPVAPMTRLTRLQIQVNQDVVSDANISKSMLMATLDGVLYVF